MLFEIMPMACGEVRCGDSSQARLSEGYPLLRVFSQENCVLVYFSDEKGENKYLQQNYGGHV